VLTRVLFEIRKKTDQRARFDLVIAAPKPPYYFRPAPLGTKTPHPSSCTSITPPPPLPGKFTKETASVQHDLQYGVYFGQAFHQRSNNFNHGLVV
jgi:hypothetical protein